MKTIPEIMYDWARARPDKQITRISPSMIGRCMRTHYYTIKGIAQTTPPNPGAQLNFKLGYLWEQVMSESLRNSSIPFIQAYHMVNEELNLEGTLDFAPYDPLYGEWEVWDSKTEGSLASTYRNREGKTFFQAHPEYVHQLNAYYMLMKEQGFKVSRGRFGIIVKDNGMVTEETVNFTDQSLNETLARIQKLNDHLKDNVVPDCECEGWQVGYCSMGRLLTQAKSKTGKIINTECCALPDELEKWRNESE